MFESILLTIQCSTKGCLGESTSLFLCWYEAELERTGQPAASIVDIIYLDFDKRIKFTLKGVCQPLKGKLKKQCMHGI